MARGLILGIIVGLLIAFGAAYFYVSSGQMPVATSSPNMPFERKAAKMALGAYLAKLPHPEPQVPETEASYLAAAPLYKQNCAVCHGLPNEKKTNIALGMAPFPPQLLHGTGVTDDEAWETYWKIENGIRMTGMPGFKGNLSETQIWQITVLMKNADKLSDTVKAALKPEVIMIPTVTPGAAEPEHIHEH